MGDTVMDASAGWVTGLVMVAASGLLAASLGAVATAGLNFFSLT